MAKSLFSLPCGFVQYDAGGDAGVEGFYLKIRAFAPVSVDGKSLSKELLREGLAWWYQKYSPDDSDLAEAQAQAMKNKVGIWSDPKPVPPWEFRWKGKKKDGGVEATESE